VDRPRVSTVLSCYFYYETGCQVLFVKKYDECLGVGSFAYWYSDVGCATATLRLSLGASFLEKRDKWRTPTYFGRW
jgi:hypothetical protein